MEAPSEAFQVCLAQALSVAGAGAGGPIARAMTGAMMMLPSPTSPVGLRAGAGPESAVEPKGRRRRGCRSGASTSFAVRRKTSKLWCWYDWVSWPG